MITKVTYLNLDEHTDRDFYMRAMLSGQDCPVDIIDRFPAIRGADYTSRDAIIAEAVADGFPFFELLSPEYIDLTIVQVAIQWGWCRLLKSLTERSGLTLVMIDDFALRQPFWKLERIIPEDVQILQIMRWHPPKMQAIFNFNTYNEHIYYGLNGAGDQCTVYSDDGAEMMLRWIAEDPTMFPELQVYRHSLIALRGCFSVIDPHLWTGAVSEEIFTDQPGRKTN